MLKFITVAAAASLAITVTASQPALAGDGGAIAAGVIGGLAIGAVVGSQAYPDRHYYGGPAYSHQYYEPVYSSCRIERESYVDGYGRYRSRRIRVCD